MYQLTRDVVWSQLLTGGAGAGVEARIQVDQGSTGFHQGREFYLFHEFVVPASGVYLIRAVLSGDIVLRYTRFESIGGDFDVEVISQAAAGGTEGGGWTPIPVFPANTMVPALAYGNSSFVSVAQGGTYAGEAFLINKWPVRAPSIAAPSAARYGSNGLNDDDEYGVGAGNYYYRVVNLTGDAVTGYMRGRWENRPPGIA